MLEIVTTLLLYYAYSYHVCFVLCVLFHIIIIVPAIIIHKTNKPPACMNAVYGFSVYIWFCNLINVIDCQQSL